MAKSLQYNEKNSNNQHPHEHEMPNAREIKRWFFVAVESESNFVSPILADVTNRQSRGECQKRYDKSDDDHVSESSRGDAESDAGRSADNASFAAENEIPERVVNTASLKFVI